MRNIINIINVAYKCSFISCFVAGAAVCGVYFAVATKALHKAGMTWGELLDKCTDQIATGIEMM